MLVFIDESGDAGFKLSKGSSNYFTIALITFKEDLDAEETALKIKKYKKKLNKNSVYEFHFNKMNKFNRLNFLKEVRLCKFKIRAIVFDKKILYSNHLRNHKTSFYSYAVKCVLEHNNNKIKNAKLRLDGSGERAFKRSLSVYLRRNLNSSSRRIMNNLKFVDSKDDVLIQLADIVAGAINRSFDIAKGDSKDYIKILKRNIEDVWEFK